MASDSSPLSAGASTSDAALNIGTDVLSVHAKASAEATARLLQVDLTAGLWKVKAFVGASVTCSIGNKISLSGRVWTVRYARGRARTLGTYVDKVSFALTETVMGSCLTVDSLIDSVTQEVRFVNDASSSLGAASAVVGDRKEVSSQRTETKGTQQKVVDASRLAAATLTRSAVQKSETAEKKTLTVSHRASTQEAVQQTVAELCRQVETLAATGASFTGTGVRTI